ncbi:uncharacterized protein LOC110012715 [Sesamum indicum]|uniref:Uncharacterized protein LOC110012715 n=1 Tax=Sesamum indicum TaxID=4182 RepID=A0A8M8V9V5_SESIN|nr:uncharacterized protein LOC110012715 [Sesamum indicum]
MADKKPTETRKQDDSRLFSENTKLQNNDHATISLVTTPFDGNNYFTWARSIRFALGARGKERFIDGTCTKPEQDKTEIEQWRRADCMVITWILNSISKDIAEAFLCTTSSRNLWLDLEARFGASNGPLLYQLQKEVSSVSQGNTSLAAYSIKLKKLWDEQATLDPPPICSCGAGTKFAEKTNFTQLIQFLMGLNDAYDQFLMGLNDAYDHIRNQILVMDPLPLMGRAYSMVLQVEKQREVNAKSLDFNK